MCSHSAPPLIIRLHSAVSWPKSEARTEGEIIARGMVVRVIDEWSALMGISGREGLCYDGFRRNPGLNGIKSCDASPVLHNDPRHAPLFRLRSVRLCVCCSRARRKTTE